MVATGVRRFDFSLVADWPPLAWLARVRRSGSAVAVLHGGGIEVGDDWFCEAVWAGDYAAADFDRSDLVAGSGGRIRGGRVLFVSAGSTVDRLQSLASGDSLWISNSLCCLLTALDARIDPSYPRYSEDFRSIIHGLSRYRRFLASSAGPVELTYFDNLSWDGVALSRQPKPGADRDLSSFARYRDFLAGSLQLLAENLGSPLRQHRYEFLGTLSSGYDSATVTTLAREHGCREVICVDEARGGDEDSGEALAPLLGVTPRLVRRDAWRAAVLPEVPFIAADAKGEDVFLRGAEPLLAGRVLLTGFHGDRIWSKEPGDLSEDLLRGDQSGLDLTEYRLRVGFLHCPITFWGARQIREVNRISRSPEMRPWDVPGDYSRPICRRIVEEAGVPREMFGVRKRAASVMFHGSEHFLSPPSAADYLEWLHRNRAAWIRRGRLPPLRSPALDRWKQRGREALFTRFRDRRVLWRLSSSLVDSPTRMRRYVFPWAFEHLRSRYRSPAAAELLADG